MKILIFFAVILIFPLFGFSDLLAFGTFERKIFNATNDEFWPQRGGEDPVFGKNFLESYYKMGIFSIDLPKDGDPEKFMVTSQPEGWETPGPSEMVFALNFTETPSSGLFETVKITKSELKILALPLSQNWSPFDGYSGKFLTTLYLCQYGENPMPAPGNLDEKSCEESQLVDSVVVHTDDLPKFLTFDVTGIVDKLNNSDSKNMILRLDSRLVEFVENDIFFLAKRTPKLQENYDKIYSQVFDLPGRDPNDYHTLTYPDIPPFISDIFGLEISELTVAVYGEDEDSVMVLSMTVNDTDFFMTPKAHASGKVESTPLTPTTLTIDYEILDSDFRKNINYFIIVVLPAIAIIIPAVSWIIKKKK